MFYAHRSDRYNFIMCTNGRCGSTTIKRWYLRCHDMPMPDPDDHASIHNALQYGDPRFFVDRSKFNEYPHYKFLVARNPWSRLVSFYKTYVVIRQTSREGLDDTATFRQLIETLIDRGPLDPHVALQMQDLDGLRFDAIVRVESMSQDMDNVSKACAIPWNASDFASSLFSSPASDSHAFRDVPNTSGVEFKKSDTWPRWEDFYTRYLSDAVARIYARDISEFGYLPPAPASPDRPQSLPHHVSGYFKRRF